MNDEKDRRYYDEAFMEIFSNRKIVKSLFEDFVKEQWVELIDFSSMEATKSVFKGINDSKKESDLLLKFNLVKKKPEKIYIFILMEFQSTAEPMILRLLEYLVRIYKRQKEEVKTQCLASLFPVVPLVIYNGKEKWSEKNTFIEHFSLSSDDIRKYIPDFKYILIDIARFGDELLESLKDAISYFFLLDKTDIRRKDKAAIRIIGILRDLRKKDPEIFKLLGRYISGLLKYKGVEIDTINDYIDDRGESMLAQSIDELKEECRVEGELEDKHNVLIRLLELKYGLSDEEKNQILSVSDFKKLDAALDAIVLSADKENVLKLL